MESSETKFNPAQEDALKKAYTLLGEHFDYALISISTDYEADMTGRTCAQEVVWKGGYISAIGLAEYAKHKILTTKQ